MTSTAPIVSATISSSKVTPPALRREEGIGDPAKDTSKADATSASRGRRIGQRD